MSIINKLPDERQDLVSNFKMSKTLYPLMTVQRSSEALVHNSSGHLVRSAPNTPRVDYDPTTKECKGLLVEGQSTNLLTDSCGFVTGWNLIGVTSESTSIDSPMVDQKAVRIRNTAENSQHWFHQSKPHESSKKYFGSIFVKYEEGGAEWICLDYANYVNIANSGKYYFNLKTKEVIGDMQVVSYPNGWYRLIITATIISGSNEEIYDPETGETTYVGDSASRNTSLRMRFLKPGDDETYVGSLSQTMLFWGAQDEQSEYCSLPIITGSSAVTRTTEILRINRTGSSDISFRIAATIPMQGRVTNIDSNRRRNLVNFSEPSSWNNRIMVYQSGLNITALQTAFTVHRTVVLDKDINKNKNYSVSATICGTYDSARKTIRFSINGERVLSIDSEMDASALSVISIGEQTGGLRSLFGHIKDISVSDLVLTDEELVAFSKV